MQSSRRRAWVLAVAAIVATVAVACGGGPDPDPEIIARGERLYAASCVRCHGGPTGGQISDMPPRHNAQGHTWHHGSCVLTDIVLDGLPPRQGATGNKIMPAFRGELTDAEIDAILTYVTTWWTNEQRAIQAQVTEEQCTDR